MNTFDKEETRQNKRRYVIFLLLLIIVGLIGALIYLYSRQLSPDKNAVGIVKTESGENSVDYASIPGFKTLIFIADSKEQNVDFYSTQKLIGENENDPDRVVR